MGDPLISGHRLVWVSELIEIAGGEDSACPSCAFKRPRKGPDRSRPDAVRSHGARRM
jgi:hypothetical protein